MPATCETRYVIAVLARLKGAARDSTYGKTFSNLSDLIQHLEQRFAPHKTYLWYVREITTIQMLQNEGIYEFYDRLTLLKSRAQAFLKNRYENANQMILPLDDCVLEAFIRGLPDWMSAKIEARNPVTLQEAFEYAINYEARHQTDRLFFQHFSRYQQPSYRDPEEKNFSPEGRSTPNGLKSTNPAQDPDERLSDFENPVFESNLDQQQQYTQNVKFNPYQNSSTHQNYNHRQSNHSPDYRIDYLQREELDSAVSANSITKNLLGKSARSNKVRVKTKKEDFIREEKVIKECRKRKRSTSDPQSEVPLALKIVKASTLLNTTIPRTSLTGYENTAKVTEESQDALVESHKHYKSQSIHTHQSSFYPTSSPELGIQTAWSTPDLAKALIIDMPMELKKGYNQQLNSEINGLFWTQSPLQRTLEREPCGIG